MRNWDLTAKVPQKVHASAASAKEYSKWHTHISYVIRHVTPQGYKVFIQDESIVGLDGKTKKKFWCRRDERPQQIIRGNHQKFMIYGIKGINGEQCFRAFDKFDGPTFFKFVKIMVGKYKKIVLIVDRARQHMTKKLEKYVKANKDKIKIEYLPPASPQLSSIEAIWLKCKREKDYSIYYPTIDDKKRAIMEYLRTQRFPNNVMDYFAHESAI
ncbi:MAG: Transposase [Cenarchaeum symbiont of Oopsacas minuta]|nr:Transposase [Cenarchaeum symbiont of Oopsacas minuta]